MTLPLSTSNALQFTTTDGFLPKVLSLINSNDGCVGSTVKYDKRANDSMRSKIVAIDALAL